MGKKDSQFVNLDIRHTLVYSEMFFQCGGVTPRHAPHPARQAKGDYSMKSVFQDGEQQYIFVEEELRSFARCIAMSSHIQCGKNFDAFFSRLRNRFLIKMIFDAVLKRKPRPFRDETSLGRALYDEFCKADPCQDAIIVADEAAKTIMETGEYP